MPYFEFPESETRKQIEEIARRRPFKWFVSPDDPMSNLPIGTIGSPLKSFGRLFRRQPAIPIETKIANLRRAAKNIQATYTEKPMIESYQHVVEYLKKLTGGIE